MKLAVKLVKEMSRERVIAPRPQVIPDKRQLQRKSEEKRTARFATKFGGE